jgi:hypothetical protein
MLPRLPIFVACLLTCGLFVGLASGSGRAQELQKVSFEKQVQPILSNHCWNCHGLDEETREGGLRLDLQESALGKGESGLIAIVPGDPGRSELMARIEAHDADTQMPPASTKKPLSEEQKKILRQWIAEGAEFSVHWAFETPERPAVPNVKNSKWVLNPVDSFVLERLEKESLPPNEEAASEVWLRRVTLDLTGLPPSLEELTDFEASLQNSPTETVYAAVVDRLLSSPRYGETMAMYWLDAARYADTNGYNNDETRTMWPWRDWVINAFVTGMPYDQFLTEQLAGDLLPNATISQKVATGFNRNHVLTTEGGIIEEEYHVEYVADRVHTTSTVFLALSMQCARCHDHKFDPISQRDYYQFASFFNNVPDKVVSYNQARMAEPLLKVPSPEQTAELARIERRTLEIDALLKARLSDLDAPLAAWEKTLTPDQIARAGLLGLQAHISFHVAAGPEAAPNTILDAVTNMPLGRIVGAADRVDGRQGQALRLDGNNYVDLGQAGSFELTDKFTSAAWIQLTSNEASTVLSKIDEANAYRGYDVIIESGKIAAHFVHTWPGNAFKVVAKNAMSLNQWHHVAVSYDGSGRASGVKIYVDGVAQEFVKETDNELTGTLRTDKPFHIGRRQSSASFKGLIDDVQIYAMELSPEAVASLAKGESFGELAKILSTPSKDRTEAETLQLRQYFLNTVDPVASQLRQELAALPKQREEVEKAIPATMIMSEPAEPRPAFILKRGQYDQRGEQVESEYPQALSKALAVDSATQSTKRTRLDLAHWLTDPRHPLTARVAVNRWWEMLFGTGLVETSEDFGVQGAFPSHPELLDWLATELIAQKWDQRAILKQMVLSATYRQSSRVTPEQLERDPRNLLLARGPRYRLSAETVRDAALYVSGLFKEYIGGPSVKPYQPEGLWEEVSVERRDKYVPDLGDGLYRRSMYTFWKRTCPPPSMSTFDAPDREFCLVRRARTNTPLQALVLMNDPTYIEASRKLAEQCLLAADNDSERIRHAFRRVLSRYPAASELETVLQVVQEATAEFAVNPDAANELLSVGHSPREPALDPNQLAAWTTAMSVLFNLDEAISKP